MRNKKLRKRLLKLTDEGKMTINSARYILGLLPLGENYPTFEEMQTKEAQKFWRKSRFM